MALPSCLLVSVGGRRSQHPGPSPILGSLGPSHQWRHKSGVLLRGPPCAYGVSGTPHGDITLSSKPELTFLKEHQIGLCWFDALSRAKVTLSLSFT